MCLYTYTSGTEYTFDEIIKSLEAGNVSMTTSNSLINGGAALFGMKADLQFGKLRVNALFAQQNSESKTVNSKGGVQTKDFELKIDEYDANRHFFLAHYFRNRYNDAPLISELLVVIDTLPASSDLMISSSSPV